MPAGRLTLAARVQDKQWAAKTNKPHGRNSIRWDRCAPSRSNGAKNDQAMASNHLTNIEQMFRKEILIIRLCGGFMFDWCRPSLALIYRLCAILSLRLWTFSLYINYTKLFRDFSKTSLQNTSLFLTSHYLAFNLATLVSVATGLRYHRLLLILLRKQLDARYLSRRQRHTSKYLSGVATLDEGASRFSRIQLARRLLLANLLLAAASLVSREYVYANKNMLGIDDELAKPTPARQPTAGWHELLQRLALLERPQGAWRMLLAAVQGAINTNSVYGQLYVVFLIVSTITDMLTFAANRDRQLQPAGQLTSELLVQVREVLIAIRCATSLDYLMCLLCDITRLMAVFCLFIESIGVGKNTVMALALFEYLRVAFNMLLTRIGFHWFHSELERIKRRLDQQNLLAGQAKHEGSASNADNKPRASEDRDIALNLERRNMTHFQRLTTYKLADDIEKIWPTDWFTPDLKSFLSQNILVITLVATMQQLVEVNTRVEYRVGGARALPNNTNIIASFLIPSA